MGGGASQGKNQNVIAAKEKMNSILNPKAMFDIHHEIFRNKMLCNEITEDLLKSEDIRSSTIDRLQILAKKWEVKAKKEGVLSLEDLQNLFCQLLGENLIKKYLEMPQYDLFKVLNEVYNSLGFPEEKTKDWKKVIELFQKEFEMNLKTIVYNLDKELKDFNKVQIIGMNSNLKYHPDYQVRVLTVVITQKFLENKEVANDLADVIEKSTKLQVVIFILYPTDANDNVLDTFGFDASDYKTIYKLFNGVTKNRGIKALFFHSIKDYKIIIAPEIASLIINKLQSETLVAFHLGNFSISKDLYKKLFFQVVSTRSMLFLSLHLNEDFGEHFSIFSIILEKNNSLVAFALGGVSSTNGEKVAALKDKLAKKPKPIDVVYVGEKSYITYPFIIQK